MADKYLQKRIEEYRAAKAAQEQQATQQNSQPTNAQSAPLSFSPMGFNALQAPISRGPELSASPAQNPVVQKALLAKNLLAGKPMGIAPLTPGSGVRNDMAFNPMTGENYSQPGENLLTENDLPTKKNPESKQDKSSNDSASMEREYRGPIDPKGLKKAQDQLSRTGLKVSDIQDGLKKAQDQQADGLKMQATASEKLAKSQNEINELTRLKMEAQTEKYQADKAKAEKLANDKMLEIESLSSEIKKTKLKAKNPYNENGGGKGIALVILSAISGAAAGFRGKESNVLDIINNNINMDYQTQKDNLENKRASLSDQRNIYKELKDKVEDEDQRYVMFRNIILQDAQLRLAQAADTASSDQAKAKYIQGIGLLEQQRQNDILGLRQKVFDSNMKRLQLQADIAQTPMAEATKVGIRKKEQHDMDASWIDGLTYNGKVGADQEQKKNARAAWSAAQTTRSLLDDAINLRAKHGTEYLNREAVNQGKSISRALVRQIKVLENMGANFTEMEKQLVDIPEDLLETSWNIVGGSDSVSTRLRQAQRVLQKKTDDILKANNYQREIQDNWDAE